MLLIVGLVWIAPAAAADGDPDADFGDASQVMIPRPDAPALQDAAVGDLEMLPDGRVLWIMEDGSGGAWLSRLESDGTPDADFGDKGRVQIDSCVLTRPMRLVAQSDGGAVVWTGACLLRFDAAGIADPDFASGATFPPSPMPFGFQAAELRRDSVGRWLLAGQADQQWQVRRYLPDGSDDLSFGVAGVASPPVPATQNGRALHAMALRPDDRIVLAGARRDGSENRLVVFQLDGAGAPDADFGDAGLAEVAPPDGYQGLIGEALAIDRDGSIAIGGQGRNAMSSCCVMVARLSANGTLVADSLRLFSLGSNVSLAPFGETSTSLALLPGGDLLLARNAFPPFQPPLNTRTRFTLIRMRSDGVLDATFGGVGWRSYLIADPTHSGIDGAYVQIHGMAYAAGRAVMFGRTFYEDAASLPSYVTLLKVGFDRLFVEGFDR